MDKAPVLRHNGRYCLIIQKLSGARPGRGQRCRGWTGLGRTSLARAQATPYAGEEVTITYGFWDSAQEAAIEAQLEAFKAVYPNITVEPQIVPWEDYWTQLQTAVAGGETFDVFWINSASLPVYASSDALLPIDAIVGAGGVDPAMFPAPLVEMYSYEGV